MQLVQGDLQVQIVNVAIFLVISRDHNIHQTIIKAQNPTPYSVCSLASLECLPNPEHTIQYLKTRVFLVSILRSTPTSHTPLKYICMFKMSKQNMHVHLITRASYQAALCIN